MQNNLLEQIKEIKCDEHYLRKVNSNYDYYVNELQNIIQKLEQKVTSKQIKNLLTQKLQINEKKFNESQYIQCACELTVMSEFLNNNYEFMYENKVSPPKDVDFSLEKDGIQYNIEVKCPSYIHDVKEENTIEFSFTNRAPTIKCKNDILEAMRKRLENINLVEKKNLDNTLKDFLISTQSKVDKSPLDNVNILVVCCNDELDLFIWRNYLFGNSGFFTNKSYITHDNFNRVDFICLTNIYNRHYKYYDDTFISNHWKLSSSFNLLYPNRDSLRNQNVNGKDELQRLNQIFPNQNLAFEKYLNDDNDIPEGETLEMKKLYLGIVFYMEKFKKRNIYYFKTKI